MMSPMCKQRGLSLISLMVGLFISMLCILAGLTLYKSTVAISTEARISTQLDGQITSALLTLQLELQNAAFGMTGDSVSQVVVTQYGNDQVLAWRYKDGADYICRGVKESASGSAPTFRTLSLVTADGCTELVDLSTLNWSPTDTTVIGRWPVIGDELVAYIAANTNLFTLGAPAFTNCSPYGALASAEHLQLTVRAPSSASLYGVTGAINHSITVCLLNTTPA